MASLVALAMSEPSRVLHSLQPFELDRLFAGCTVLPVMQVELTADFSREGPDLPAKERPACPALSWRDSASVHC